MPEDQPAFWRFCRYLLKADTQILQTEIRHTQGEYVHEPILTPVVPSVSPAPLVKLSEIIAQFTADHIQANRWQAKTQTDNAAMFRDFTEIVGDVTVDNLTKEVVRQYRQVIRKLPPNRTKQVRYRSLNISQILELTDVAPMSVCRINKHLTLIGQLCKWAINQGYLASNPASGMQLPTEKRPQEARSPFTGEELKRIFLSPEFSATSCGTQPRSSYMYWLPILGLHTGALLEELAQLTTSDVREVDGVWIIDINREDGRRGMTSSNWFARYLTRRKITGHENPTMSYGLYGKALRPEVQFEYLKQIDFGVDLLSLKDIWPTLMNR
jgi:integrase